MSVLFCLWKAIASHEHNGKHQELRPGNNLHLHVPAMEQMMPPSAVAFCLHLLISPSAKRRQKQQQRNLPWGVSQTYQYQIARRITTWKRLSSMSVAPSSSLLLLTKLKSFNGFFSRLMWKLRNFHSKPCHAHEKRKGGKKSESIFLMA